ncbi:MAG: hypothetical protein AAF562_13020 [Pseudomonadota bacterium]
MPTIFTRLYDSEEKANSVIQKIKSHDFAERRIDTVSKPGPALGVEPDAAIDTGVDTLMAQLRDLGVYPKAAAQYANKMAPGHVLVVVNAPFGSAGPVDALLNMEESIDVGVAYESNLVSQSAAPINIIRVSGARSIIRVSGSKSITKRRAKPRTKPYKSPTPFLGLKTIIKSKGLKRRPSNRPLTGGNIISR